MKFEVKAYDADGNVKLMIGYWDNVQEIEDDLEEDGYELISARKAG